MTRSGLTRLGVSLMVSPGFGRSLCIELLRILCLFLLLHLCCFTVCIAVLHTAVAGLLARGQCREGPATGHLDTGFYWFPCI
jgi:hypothetical protein